TPSNLPVIAGLRVMGEAKNWEKLGSWAVVIVARKQQSARVDSSFFITAIMFFHWSDRINNRDVLFTNVPALLKLLKKGLFMGPDAKRESTTIFKVGKISTLCMTAI